MTEIKIVLVKASWCSHCRTFEPLYEEAKKKYKKIDFLVDNIIDFFKYDINEEKEKKKFTDDYSEKIFSSIVGYPTVLLIISDNDKHKDDESKHKIHEINTTKKTDKKTEGEAINEFLNNIEAKLKTILSENKNTYINTETETETESKIDTEEEKEEKVHTGGAVIKNNINYIDYKKKYYKYKHKYLKLNLKN
jgi:thiol-disulfide isomerase/thioredoxin